MKTLKINGKDYKIEYTFEASLYNECIETTIELVSKLSESKSDVKDAIKSMATIPATTITMFYAGLLEYHKDEIKSTEDAKELAKAYFHENKGNEEGTFFGLMNTLMSCMEDDGFFTQIGLSQMIEAVGAKAKPRKSK